ncbi:RNA polymerase II C-terminal domain kinase beta subunit [Dipsacomyces acuminosporus]|nr:RNA polymerase II C-terminal domain kinase beta subunit [Dipsacomyces acuminosporus]
MLNSSTPGAQQTPSERHEILDHPAMIAAAKSCVFIKQVARAMGFPARTISTAQLLVHRTYIYRPSAAISSTDLAMACLFVAAKMEETIKKLRDILAHSYIISSQTKETDVQSVAASITDKMRPSVLAGEQFVLNAIGFDFHTTHPHLLFVKMAKLADVQRSTAVAGWTILDDAYFTTLPVQYPSVVIAAGSLILAWNLECESPQDVSRFIKQLYCASTNSSGTNGGSANGGSTNSSSGNRGCRNGPGAQDTQFPTQARKRPASVNLSDEWWLDFGIMTDDIRGFVRQMVDFYLLFFTNAASTQYMERHNRGLPSKEMSQRIGQWRLRLSNATITPISPPTNN